MKEATHSKIHIRVSEAKVHGQKKTLVQSLKQFHACFHQVYEKGMTWVMVNIQGLHMSDGFKCSNVLANVGLRSFCLWCLKLGGTPKWLPSILERCIIGWQMCATYASCLPAWIHRACWNTILGVEPSVTRNAQNKRDRERGKKSHKKRSKSWGWKETFWLPSLEVTKGSQEWNATQHLLSSLARECKLVHFLNFSGSSQLHFLVESSLSQTNCHFFLQSQCLWCNGAYVNHSVLCFIVLLFQP